MNWYLSRDFCYFGAVENFELINLNFSMICCQRTTKTNRCCGKLFCLFCDVISLQDVLWKIACIFQKWNTACDLNFVPSKKKVGVHGCSCDSRSPLSTALLSINVLHLLHICLWISFISFLYVSIFHFFRFFFFFSVQEWQHFIIDYQGNIIFIFGKTVFVTIQNETSKLV